jgi:hypothetical protein
METTVKCSSLIAHPLVRPPIPIAESGFSLTGGHVATATGFHSTCRLRLALPCRDGAAMARLILIHR